jgi:hypothetical protein
LIYQNLSRLAFLAALALPAIASAQTPPPTPETPVVQPSVIPSISGYMDFHFNKRQFEDGVLDFHRFVLLFTHQFTDRIRFVSELELAHAFVEGLEEAGELELEQAYLDFLITRAFNVRAGMLLVPVGILNERHEPPVFHGVERPLVDTVIVPTTWFDVGAGIHGEIGRGWRYRAYVMAPLNAAEFSAEEGLRAGQQHGAEANLGRAAVTARVEYVGYRGLTIGASAWSGRSGFEFRPRFDVPVSVVEADARYARDRLELRAQFAQVSIGNADRLNDTLALRVGVNPNIARTLRGAYAETSYRVVSGRSIGDVALFTRYERANTQHRMPAGFLPIAAFDRDQWVVGATYWPEPDGAIQADNVVARRRSTNVPPPHANNRGQGGWV